MTALRLRMVAVVALAGLTLWTLAMAGSERLPAPPIGSWGAAAVWYDQVGADTAVMAALRLLAMLGVGWLLLAAALQLVASLSLGPGARRLADAMSPRALRRLAHGAASLSVTAGLAVPSITSVGAMPVDDPPGTAVMEVLVDLEATTTTTVTTPPAVPKPAPVSDGPSPVSAAPVVTEPVRSPSDHEAVVEVGDSFWRIAVEVLADAGNDQPLDGEVIEYWQRLIDANRGRLVDPTNPDLLFQGQILTLPSV